MIKVITDFPVALDSPDHIVPCGTMRINCISVCKNEKKLLPYFLRHYGSFCDKITIYDGHSDDGSVEIIKAHPKTVLIQQDDGKATNEHVLTKIRNESWKSDRDYDWQIVVDLDEFLWHKDIRSLLEQYKRNNITVPRVQGVEMFSDTFPTEDKQIYDIIKLGKPYSITGSSLNFKVINQRTATENKSVIFSPSDITAMNYTVGSHFCCPTGVVRQSEKFDLKLLHYRFIGYEETVKRYKFTYNRLSEVNKLRGYGDHCERLANLNLMDYMAIGADMRDVIDTPIPEEVIAVPKAGTGRVRCLWRKDFASPVPVTPKKPAEVVAPKDPRFTHTLDILKNGGIR